jgi:translation initiation factor IF-2
LATIETVAEEFGVPVLQDDVEEAAKKTVDMIETDDIESLIKRTSSHYSYGTCRSW